MGTAQSGSNCGTATDAAANFGCEEIIKPGICESPHPQFKTGPRALSSSDCFFWQQREIFGAPRRLPHPHEDFWTLGPQQQPPVPDSVRSFPQHPRSPD